MTAKARPRPEGRGRSPVLRIRDLAKRYGTVQANDGIGFDLEAGEIVALLGENGAGKTTLVNLIFGHDVPDRGTIEVQAAGGGLEPLPQGSPRAALDHGIGMVHQHAALALNLDALDNILLGSEPLWRLSQGRRQAQARVQELMQATGLVLPLDRQVAGLSLGERQRVEILKALYRDARLIVLDEPTAVLTPLEAGGLFKTLGALRQRGLTILLISHKLEEVLANADRIVVLRAGRKVAELPAASVDQQQLATLMVGTNVAPVTNRPHKSGDVVLQLDAVSVPASATSNERLEEASLQVRAGEVVGIAGVSGNGQAALARLLAGSALPSAGAITLAGEPYPTGDAAAVVKAGVGRIPDDRHRLGVVGSMTAAENIAIERLDDPEVERLGVLRPSSMRATAASLMEDYDVRGAGVDGRAGALSGGNMQKLILARVLSKNPRLVVANHPTRGLDVGAQKAVHERLLAARDAGAAILFVSDDLDEVLQLADRVAVMHQGRLVDGGDDPDRGRLGLLMAGGT